MSGGNAVQPEGGYARRPIALAIAVALPETGFLRLRQIIGDPKANPPIPAIFPIGKTAWWEGVRSSRFPKPYKLGPKVTLWRIEDIRELIAQIANNDVPGSVSPPCKAK
jgi:predicted DNA-binding transcriptional regulator AlpA